ncbi:pentapeptide repeat-containing protein [Xenorhabdus stockiae]|uniref:pentapeptide repeat-containing protein n=1 Tax=Xenorhabdus TaxID=626 RepID=UPI001E541ABC|nr:pentapeptide repeat-containing protein [Xenorhabdus sp. PB30.3]MCC8381048.1 pentapeptide repeat-containing protein [Xenorhabdus sp. PB30.3]
MLENSERVTITDKKFTGEEIKNNYINTFFIRVVAKDMIFIDVNFRYCIFDAAYLRNCKFESCDFTGCRFINSNLVGSAFNGCKFDYTMFEKTQIDTDILLTGCPSAENLKLKFARSLRTNYQQIGDAKAANKAINIELKATEEHLYKAWHSKESYYRKKYKGFVRASLFTEWLKFKLLDFIWGNGESAYKLFRAVLLMLVIITIYDVFKFGDPNIVNNYWSSFVKSPQILFGVNGTTKYPGSFLALMFATRLIMFGFFMSIIIKRFNRR